MTSSTQFNEYLMSYPSSLHEHLLTIVQSGGMLTGEHCRAVMESLNIPAEELMLRLLPLAGLYSRAPISDFRVGAVAKAQMSDNAGDTTFFLGANIEFPSQALMQTIHAEQSAIINAWLRGAKQIDGIAVTAAPCGCCRQFLYELEGSQNLKIILNNQINGKMTQHHLSNLLPGAFGPRELGQEIGLMTSPTQYKDIKLKSSSNDPLVWEALSAAKKSYAPYSQNHAGCAMNTDDGKMYAGRYAENAAFNPSLSPLHTAVIRMNMDNLESDNKITRSVLVERSTSISQRAVCELLLKTVAPDVNLEYYEAN